MALYRLGNSVHEDRLREAEWARLSSAAKSVSANKFKMQIWHINVKDVFTWKSVAKAIHFAHFDYIIALKET
jgi:hypothetical protein